jgi:hypothetical protein
MKLVLGGALLFVIGYIWMMCGLRIYLRHWSLHLYRIHVNVDSTAIA